MSRTSALESLLSLDASLVEAQAALSAFPWDSDKELVSLESRHLVSALTRYVNDELNERQIEEWANAIECREDIAFDASTARECLHELANPLLEQPLTKIRAQWWIAKLK
jgi:tRNA(His) 5'-end guanylyltransferase